MVGCFGWAYGVRSRWATAYASALNGPNYLNN